MAHLVKTRTRLEGEGRFGSRLSHICETAVLRRALKHADKRVDHSARAGSATRGQTALRAVAGI